ncbi:MAG: hypothetical protein IJ308_02035 [Clostridia bacterium]|nr:hypothetical protein [Clostridia bacterium]
MNYVKKMCILRQIKQGFSADGKPLTGLIKAEQYGKNLAAEVSIINFAPLTSGEYFCLLSDGKGKTEMLALRGKSLFNLLTDMDISEGFCAVICLVKNEVVPIAYGVAGNKVYDWRAILNATLPPVFPQNNGGSPTDSQPITPSKSAPTPAQETPLFVPQEIENKPSAPNAKSYNDERVAEENYYEEKEDERQQFEETLENAYTTRTSQEQSPQKGADAAENVHAPRVLHPFAVNPDGYYLSVKGEIDELFRTYPRDYTLSSAFHASEWVRIRGEASSPRYLVGVLYEDGKATYICYALWAQDKNNPPDEIKGVCTFVPSSVFNDEQGFFVIFQSATNGECVKPSQI